MENIIRQIDHRIAMKRVALMEKDLNKMEQAINSYDHQLKRVSKTYDKLLLKDKPVGSGINLVRYERSSNNYY